MKYLWTFCITHQPCHIHFCCWMLPIWPELGFWAENGADGLYGVACRYNRSMMSFSWPYMILSIIWNTSALSASHLSSATAIFVVDGCQFGPSGIFWLKIELMVCVGLVGGTTEQKCIFPDIIWYYQLYETLQRCLHRTSAVPQPFFLLMAANLALAGFLG